MGMKKTEKHQLLTRTYTNQTTSWLVRSLSTFGARMSHKQTHIHKTHHGLDVGEATIFPLTIYFVHGHEANTQMSFCRSGSLEIPKIGSPKTLEAHNFVCKPLIDVKFEAKL
jgi:hypothetical protein